jgi:hypothetical protein
MGGYIVAGPPLIFRFQPNDDSAVRFPFNVTQSLQSIPKGSQGASVRGGRARCEPSHPRYCVVPGIQMAHCLGFSSARVSNLPACCALGPPASAGPCSCRREACTGRSAWLPHRQGLPVRLCPSEGLACPLGSSTAAGKRARMRSPSRARGSSELGGERLPQASLGSGGGQGIAPRACSMF